MLTQRFIIRLAFVLALGLLVSTPFVRVPALVAASMPKFYDRVMETSTTTGTGTYTLAGAVTGFRSFSVVGNTNSAYYGAEDVDANGVPTGGWEIGLGTYTTSGTTLSRDTILASSNSGSAVSWSAGTRRIFVTQPAVRTEPLIVSKTANYTATSQDEVILVDATSGNLTITLQAATARGGNSIEIKKIDSSANTVTIQRNGTPGTDLIDGASSVVITAQYGIRRLKCDGSANYYLF